MFCDSSHALTLSGNPVIVRNGRQLGYQRDKSDGGDLRLQGRCILRRLMSDGQVVARFEVAFHFHSPSWMPLFIPSCSELIDSCLEIPSTVPACLGHTYQPLITLGEALATTYLRATTKLKAGLLPLTEPWWVSAQAPLVIVEAPELAAVGDLPRDNMRVAIPSVLGVQVHHARITSHGRILSTWIITGSGTARGWDRPEYLRRQFRMHLSRLHAERECFKKTLRLIHNDRLVVDPQTPAADRLQHHLLTALRTFSSQQRFGIPQTPLLAAVESCEESIASRERASILEKLGSIRRNILKRISTVALPSLSESHAVGPEAGAAGDLLVSDDIERLSDVEKARYKPDADAFDISYWRRFVDQAPLQLLRPSRMDAESVSVIVRQIVMQFKFLIEDKGFSAELYTGKKPRPERFAQRLFFLIAFAYCKANGLELVPEADTGNGRVDFRLTGGSPRKYTQGRQDSLASTAPARTLYPVRESFPGDLQNADKTERVIVEIKLSTNSRLVKGYTTQLLTYSVAEQTASAFYVVIDVGRMGNKAAVLRDLEREAKSVGEIIFVDGRRRPTASKR